MTLPPYKHTRNPALERENEFYEYKSWEAPLITYDGIVEKRKTTDLKLIRNPPPHPGIVFEYLSPVWEGESSQSSTKNTSRESITKTGRLDSGDDRVRNKSTREDNEIKSKILSHESMNREQEDDAKSTRSGFSTKTRKSASRTSLIRQSSARSSSTSTSRTTTVKTKNLDERSDSLKLSNNREFRGLTLKSRNLANGLDEDDHSRH